MNKAQKHDTLLLIALLSIPQSLSLSKTAFIHYWPPFRRYFQQVETTNPPSLQNIYQHAFARLRTELTLERRAPFQEQTLLIQLLLLAHEYCQLPPLSNQLSLLSQNLLDSDLLLRLFNEQPAALSNQYYHHYQKAFVRIGNTSLPEAEQTSAYGEAFLLLRQHIINGQLKSPLTATLFTYFYRIFQHKLSERYRLINQQNNLNRSAISPDQTVLTSEVAMPASAALNSGNHPKHQQSNYWEFTLQRLSTLARYDFNNEKEFVHFILNQIGEKCRYLLQRFYLDGFSHDAIAQEQNLTTQKIKSRLFECRRQLNKRLNNR